MGKIKNKIKIIFSSKELYIFLGITLIFFGIFSNMQYAPDTYAVFNNSLKTTVQHFFSCGRIVTGIFIGTILGLFKLSTKSLYIISYFIAIICSTFSMYKLYNITEKEIRNKCIRAIVSILIVINIFSIELFMYIEKGIMMLSVLLSILAVEQTKKTLEGNKKSSIKALILMLLATCCYQGTVGIYVALSMIYIIKYSKNIMGFIKNNISVALLYGIPAIINFIFVKFYFKNSRIKGDIVFNDSIAKIFKGTKDMFLGTYQLFPKYLFITILSILIIYIIYKIIIKKSDNKIKILEILGIFYIILGTTIVTVLPQMLQATNSIWFVARTSYPVASLIGILIIYAGMKIKTEQKENKLLLLSFIIFLIIQHIYFINFEIDNYKVNYQDMLIAKEISNKIEKYEKESGQVVNKLSVYNDMKPNYTYYNIHASGDMNIKAFSTEWSTKDIIKNYTNKNELNIVDKDEKIEKYFKEQDWETYNEKQIIIENETLHICNY